MSASTNGLQQRLSTLSNTGVASEICTCLRELETANPSLHDRLTKLLHQLSDVKVGGNQGAKAETSPPVLDPSSVLTTLPGISCASPRGKFDVLFTSDALALRNNKHLIQVPYGSISCVYILDRMKEERAKKVFMLLQFEDNFSVTHGKKTLQNITIETKDSLELDAKFPETPANGEQPRVFKIAGLLQGAAAVVLCQLLGQMKVTNFKAPDDAVFSGRSRAPCIAALHKFNKGWLFPLKDVLVFIGTACFAMPHKDILGMDMPGVGGDRRTFDLICYGHSGDKLCELVQIDTGDLPAWGEYMRKEGLKQVAGTREEGAPSGGAEEEDDEEDEDADDEDFEADVSDGEDGDRHVADGGAFGVRRPAGAAAGSSGAGASSGAGPAAGAAAAAQLPPRKRLRSAAAATAVEDVEVLELPEGGMEEELLSEGGTDDDSEGGDSGVSSGDDA